ncbi:hypothetical protein ODJ79_45430 [Actinoplanes sp. KI2]|uniref:hypothetical protein n=1 Tax=Actinoplanes sp. KI2 TaxID=2983315 RepID=UPI0021D58F66|nr:hypothetical protein [Actinoplanes sp. KI2]MCU7731002.1 hypothetical protein [Actinoplanes sp. KI2]
MTGARRNWLIAALAVAVLVLAGSIAAVAATAGRGPAVTSGRAGPGNGSAWGYGPGMMGGAGGGMMGAAGAWRTGGRYGLPGDGRTVTSLDAAKARAQSFADRLGDGLRAGEVMQFANGYYSELRTAGGAGATEVLIDPGTGAVSIEYGPAMMWNTRYGMHATGNAPTRVSAARAVTDAQTWLDAQHTGLTAAEATAFPGYYTLHTLNGEKIAGMMSVNAVTGTVWYHTWHGTFLAMAGD